MEQAADNRFVIIGCADADKEAIARPTITLSLIHISEPTRPY